MNNQECEKATIICPKCGGNNVQIQMVTKLKKKHHGVIYWLFVGWWLNPILWLFFTIPVIIVKIFGGSKYKSKQVKMAVCQGCGHTWKF